MSRLRTMIGRLVDWADRHPVWATVILFGLALLPRVLIPSGTFFNFDAAGHWIFRTKGFLDGLTTLDIQKLVQAPHPGVTLMWITSLGEWANQTFHVYRLWNDPTIGYITVLKLPMMFVTAVLAALVYPFLRGLTTTRFALAVAAIWTVEPIYLVFSRYLHLDGLITGFFLLIVIATWRARRESSWRWTIIAAVLMGLAALTRINIIPSIVLTAMAASFARRGQWKHWIIQLGAMLGLVIATIIILWPAIVGAWPEVVKIINRGIDLGTSDHEVPSRVDNHPVVRKMLYPLFLTIRTWSWLVIFGAFGIISSLVMTMRRRRMTFGFYLVASMIAVLIVLFVADKKLDRYASPAIGPLLILAVMTGAKLWRTMPTRWASIAGGAMVGVVLLSVANLLRLAPYLQTYQNELAAFLRQSNTISTSAAFTPGWGEGYYETAKYIESLGWPSTAIRNARSFCIHRTPDIPDTYPYSPAYRSSCYHTAYSLGEASKAEYIAISDATFAQQVYPRLLRDIKRLGWKPVHIITINGKPTVYIYKNTGGLKKTIYR